MFAKVRYLVDIFLERTSEFSPADIVKLREEKEITIYAFILSLYGWKSLHEKVPGIKCDYCHSRLAFCHADNQEINAFDIHKDYCPWINAQTADARTPIPMYSTNANKRLSGVEWLMEIIAVEFLTISNLHDLSGPAKSSINEKMFSIERSISQYRIITNEWKPKLEELFDTLKQREGLVKTWRLQCDELEENLGKSNTK